MKSNLELMQNVVKPYIDAKNQALTNYVAENNVKNVYDIPSLKALSGRTHGGITYTINSDGTVSVAAGTVNGTESVFPFGDGGVGIDSTNITRATHVKPNKTYVASFGINLGAPYYIQVFYKATSSSSWTMIVEGGSGTEVEFTVPSSFYDIWIRFNIYGNGTAVPAMTLYPMIREAGIDADGSYQPYAMTNAELTPKKLSLPDTTLNQTNINNIYGNSICKIGKYVSMHLLIETKEVVAINGSILNTPTAASGRYDGVITQFSSGTDSPKIYPITMNNGNILGALRELPVGLYLLDFEYWEA